MLSSVLIALVACSWAPAGALSPPPTATVAPSVSRTKSPSASPTTSHVPTVSSAPTATPVPTVTSAPTKEDKYKYGPTRISTKIYWEIVDFTIILAAMVLGSVYMIAGHFFCAKKRKDIAIIDDDENEKDALQIANSMVWRFDQLAGVAQLYVGFVSFVIASNAVNSQDDFRAFKEYNLEYNIGTIFFMFTFLLYLVTVAIAMELSKQVHFGYISPLFVVYLWALELLNAFGTLCFIHGTIEFQRTFGYTHFFKDIPKILGWTFVAIYIICWALSFWTTTTMVRDWQTLKVYCDPLANIINTHKKRKKDAIVAREKLEADDDSRADFDEKIKDIDAEIKRVGEKKAEGSRGCGSILEWGLMFIPAYDHVLFSHFNQGFPSPTPAPMQVVVMATPALTTANSTVQKIELPVSD